MFYIHSDVKLSINSLKKHKQQRKKHMFGVELLISQQNKVNEVLLRLMYRQTFRKTVHLVTMQHHLMFSLKKSDSVNIFRELLQFQI